MLSPLPLFIHLISLEMTLDIGTLCWVLRGRLKLQDVSLTNRSRIAEIFAVVFDIFHRSRNGRSTQNSPKHDT